MVQKPREITFFVQRFFFFFQKKVHTKNFTIIWAFPWFFTFIQQFWFIPVYSCQILFIPDYSCLYLSIPVLLRYIFFQKQKLPYVQVTQLPKLNCWQVCWQSQEKKSKAHFLTGAIGGTMVGMSKFRLKIRNHF